MKFRFKELNNWKLILEYEFKGESWKTIWYAYDRDSSPITHQELDYVWDHDTYMYLQSKNPCFKIYCYNVIPILEKHEDHDSSEFKQCCRYVLKTLWEQHDKAIKRKKELEEQERIWNKTKWFIYPMK